MGGGDYWVQYVDSTQVHGNQGDSRGDTMLNESFFLRSLLLVVRYRAGRYALVHPGSSVMLPTDKMGAKAARKLRWGASTREVCAALHTLDSKAPHQWEKMVARLEELGALADDPPVHDARWYLRLMVSYLGDLVLTLLATAIALSPRAVAHAVYEWLPYSPFGSRTAAQTRSWSMKYLREAGFESRGEAWLRRNARLSSAAMTRTYVLWAAAFLMPAAGFRRFAMKLADIHNWNSIMASMPREGGAVVAALHTDSYPTLIAALAAAGRPVAIVADVTTAGVQLQSGEALHDPFPLGELVDSRERTAIRKLLQTLRAGGIIVLLFDASATSVIAVAERARITFLGHEIIRFGGAAWLARRERVPLYFAATYRERARVNFWMREVSATLAAAEMSETGNAAMTDTLYDMAERFILSHPEAWLGWSYFSSLMAPALRNGQG